MTSTPHNLDQDISEYFEFILEGHNYKFQYPSAEQIVEIQKSIKENPDNVNLPIEGLITPIGDAPPFEEVWKKIRVPKIKAFIKMVQTEFSA